MKESSEVVYKEAVGFPSYRIGSDGTVWSNRVSSRGWRQLSPTEDRHGYLYVSFRRNGETHRKYVHHLVLEAFVGERPPGADGCHYPDHNPQNNTPENLQWGSRLDNVHQCIEHGRWMRGTKTPIAKLDAEKVRLIRLLQERYPQKKIGVQSFLARWFSVSGPAISDIVRGATWRHVT